MGQEVGTASGQGGNLKPPHWLEIAVGLLIPPVCREQVLGDLHERYTTLRRYFSEIVSTVPLVIWSQLRRRADPQLLLVEAAATYIAFLAAAWRWGGVEFLNQESGSLRIAIPAIAVGFVLLLAEAYVHPSTISWHEPLRVASVAFVFVWLSQAILMITNPPLVLPLAVTFSGSVMMILLLASVRALLRTPSGVDRAAAMDPGRSALDFTTTFAYVLRLGVRPALPARIRYRIIGGAVIVVALCFVWQVFRHS